MPLSTRTALLSGLLLTLAVPFVVTDEVPPKVTGVSLSKAVKDGNPSLRVTWTALKNITDLSEYRVEYRRNGELYWGTRVSTQPYSTSILLPALLPGTEYNVRMRAVSAAGYGEWSEVLTETTFDKPKVTNVSVTESVEDGKVTLTVSWTTPQSELPIAEYEVEYRTSDAQSWINSTRLSVSPPAKSTILTGLDVGVEYIVRVRASSEIGAGAWSEEQRVRADDTDNGSCYRLGKCSQPSANQTTTTPTPVPAATPLAAIVGATVAVGLVLLVLLILGAVPLVACVRRRQDRTWGEVIFSQYPM